MPGVGGGEQRGEPAADLEHHDGLGRVGALHAALHLVRERHQGVVGPLLSGARFLVEGERARVPRHDVVLEAHDLAGVHEREVERVLTRGLEHLVDLPLHLGDLAPHQQRDQPEREQRHDDEIERPPVPGLLGLLAEQPEAVRLRSGHGWWARLARAKRPGEGIRYTRRR
jgi:hypothetical protein